jgi:hypothetical protein
MPDWGDLGDNRLLDAQRSLPLPFSYFKPLDDFGLLEAGDLNT